MASRDMAYSQFGKQRKNVTQRRIIVIIIALAILVAWVGDYLYTISEPKVGAAHEEGQLVRPYSPILGPRNAPVTIVEFLDPTCRACGSYYPLVKRIMQQYPSKVRLVIRYAAFHKGDKEAIKMLEAARLQGVFEPVLASLIASQAVWNTQEGTDLAKAWQIAAQSGLDVESAKRDAAQPMINARFDQEARDVLAARVRQAPMFFINGRPLPQASQQQLIDQVRAEVMEL